jgi:integrase
MTIQTQENAMVFTEDRIRKLPPAPEGVRVVYFKDSKTRGFMVGVYPSGTRVFVLYRKVQGRPERILIGRWPDLPVEQARKIADEMNGDIAKGKNPAEERRQKRLEGTFKNLWEQYLELHAKQNKRPRSAAEDEAQHKRYLSSWDSQRLSTIRRRDVRRLHADIGEKHGIYAANRMLSLVSKMFNWAITEKEWDGENPCKGVKKFEETSRERILTGDEMPRFLTALEEEPSQDFRDFILLDLLTGARRSNLLSMEWSEIDFAGAVWRIPQEKFKSKKLQTIPLAVPALKILQSRRERVTGQWVFPSGIVKGAHVLEFRKPWKELLKRAEIGNLRLHDIRRTLGSWLSTSGAAMPVIKAALGHADIATTQIYARSEDSEVRKALELTAQKMLEAGHAHEETK